MNKASYAEDVRSDPSNEQTMMASLPMVSVCTVCSAGSKCSSS
jgi:hypothetical protein